MTLISNIALICLIGLPLMWLLYAVAVQYERGGAWRALAPLAFSVLLASWMINQSLGRLIYGKPTTWRETFSLHTQRMQSAAGIRGRIARLVKALLNFAAPREDHIK
jgi:hypothetical protein